MAGLTCMDCDGDLARKEFFTEVTGFCKQRKGGGYNQVALQAPTGRYVCVPCMHLRKAGGKAKGEQGSLL